MKRPAAQGLGGHHRKWAPDKALPKPEDSRMNTPQDTQPTAGEILRRIRAESRDSSEKGHWFEQLFMRVAKRVPEFEIDEIWRWADWPLREELTGLDGRDTGIDLVASRGGG